MGYRIRYGKTAKNASLLDCGWNFGFAIKWIAVMIASCVITFILTYYNDIVIDFLVPGDKVATKAAFTTFVEDLNNGNSIGNAITTFCEEIVKNAKLPD